MCLELVSPGARKLMRPEMTADAWVVCVRGAGSDAVLARYHKELGSAITRELEGDDERSMWRAIEDFPLSSAGSESPSVSTAAYTRRRPATRRDAGDRGNREGDVGRRDWCRLWLAGSGWATY